LATWASTSRRCPSPTHADAFKLRVADADLFKTLTQRFDDGRHMRTRRDGAPDGGAFLPGLYGHLLRDLLDEKVEFRRPRPGVGRKDCGIEGVSLCDEAD
jgi:hypothetical protein